MIRLGAAALLVLGFASPCRGQDVERYLALAREYAAGRGDDATARLAIWSPLDLSAAAEVAALTANAIIDTDPEAARFHLNMARRALTVASGRIGQRKRLEPFARRWFRFVASVYTSAELLPQARALVQQGLDLFP